MRTRFRSLHNKPASTGAAEQTHNESAIPLLNTGPCEKKSASISGELAATELLSRFIYSKSLYRKNPFKAKPSAFDPSPDNELSMAHVTGLTVASIWELAKSALGDQPGRDKIRAYASLAVGTAIEQELRAVRDNDPFERHTLLVGWPVFSDDEKRRKRWAEITLKLSQASELQLATPPLTKG